jgi:hypothetical protein
MGNMWASVFSWGSSVHRIRLPGGTTTGLHWVRAGEGFHRTNDLPALVQGDFQRAWFVHGRFHRDAGLAANMVNFKAIPNHADPEVAYMSSGTNPMTAFLIRSEDDKFATEVVEYIVQGVRHRDGDQPAVIVTGSDFVERQWYKGGQRHREDGLPAYEMLTLDGQPLIRAWFVRGTLTNQVSGGPAFQAYVPTLFKRRPTIQGIDDIADVQIPGVWMFREALEGTYGSDGNRVLPQLPPATKLRGGVLHVPLGPEPAEEAWVTNYGRACSKLRVTYQDIPFTFPTVPMSATDTLPPLSTSTPSPL